MALPTCIKCGNRLFTLHKEQANSISATPAYMLVTCSKPACGMPVGAIPDPGEFAEIDFKLNKIMKFLKIR